MLNKELMNEKNNTIRAKMVEAIGTDNAEAFADAQFALASSIQETILAEARVVASDELTGAALAARGVNILTAEEAKYYNAVIGTTSFDGTEALMPSTIIDRVFEDLVQNHPLLSEIKFENVGSATEWVIGSVAVQSAWWGALSATIAKKLEGGFEKIPVNNFKLSAYMPVAKAMLALGPQWLDKYVRTVLFESISLGFETGIATGSGKSQPIGMNRDMEGAVIDGEYPVKTATALTDLTPATLGSVVMAPLTKSGTRTIGTVIFLINPFDFWAKMYAAIMVKDANGVYQPTGLPSNVKLIESAAVPSNRMIAGMAKDYFMGVSSQVVIEGSDHYKFLEDERTYIAKVFANGRPVDNDAFLYFNIENLAAETVASI